MKALILAACILASSTAFAKPVEVWECRDIDEKWTDIIVVAMVDDARGIGAILVAGTAYKSYFHVSGFDRRWDFDKMPGNSYQYSFVISPNGDAKYFDFRGKNTASPSMLMKCRRGYYALDSTIEKNIE